MTALLDDSVLRVSLVLAAALGVAVSLGGRSAALRHCVLALGLFSAAVTPALEAVAPAWNLGARLRPETARVETRVVGIRHRLDAPTDDAGAPPRQQILVRVRADTPEAATTGHTLDAVAELLPWVWLTGVVIGWLTIAVGLVWLGRVTARARPLVEGRWHALADSLAAECGLRRRVRLRIADHPTLLVTWGFWRPTILVPSDAAAWPEDRIRVVLAHELSHVRRADWLVQTAAAVLRAIYWFNPLAWIVCARLRHESERACDDAVLETGIVAEDYADHLLAIARGFARQRRAWTPAPAIARASSLEHRVSAMLDRSAARGPVTTRALAIVAVLLLAVAVPIAGFGQGEASAVLAGELRGPDGAPLSHSPVYLTHVDTGAQLELQTDANGRFEFSGLAAGQYRVNSLSPAPLLTVWLDPGERMRRDIALQFGPFREMWSIATSTPNRQAPRRSTMPGDWRCSGPGVPLCGPESLVQEFERDEHERLDDPFLPPRRLRPVPARIGATDLSAGFDVLRSLDVQGIVEIEGRISTEGVFTGGRVVSSTHPRLEQAALTALAEARWEPARARGLAVEVPITITIELVRDSGAR